VAAVLSSAGVSPAQLDRVACGAGPGSFTSLRIAASLAKGIATGRRIPLYARSSLALIAAGARPPLPDGEYVAALDALRGEVYAALLSTRGGAVVAEQPAIRLSAAALRAYAAAAGAGVVGPGRETDASPHARGFATDPGWFASRGPVDVDSWEPDYGRLAEAQVKWEAAHGRPLREA
jgi:tRNA threonylcarbamoyladenosine biosynthesis protein TsaB